MKSIQLVNYQTFTTRDVIKQIIEAVPPTSGGIPLPEMRARMKLLDKLDATGDALDLEDAEHAHLLRLLQAFPFGVVHAELVLITDGIENAA